MFVYSVENVEIAVRPQVIQPYHFQRYTNYLTLIIFQVLKYYKHSNTRYTSPTLFACKCTSANNPIKQKRIQTKGTKQIKQKGKQ